MSEVIQYGIVKCEAGACAYGVRLPGADVFTIGDSDTPDYVTRTPEATQNWLDAVAAGVEVEQPPLAPHENDGFTLSGDTLFVPAANYDRFVKQVQTTGEFAGFTVTKQLVSA